MSDILGVAGIAQLAQRRAIDDAAIPLHDPRERDLRAFPDELFK